MGTRFKSRSVPMTLYLWREFHYNWSCAVFSVDPCSFHTAISGKIQETLVFFFFKQQSSFRSGTKDVLLDWKHFTTHKGKSWAEKISDSCLDSVQRYCEESSDRWSDNWRQSKMRARNRSACEARRLHEADTAAADRRGRRTARRRDGWRAK